jgi:hypothetical protein
VMTMKPELLGRSMVTVSVTDNSDGGCPRQQSADVSRSFNAEFSQAVRATSDLFSTTAMEERYAIREEGIF